MLVIDFENLKVDDLVTVTGRQDGQRFVNEVGRVVETEGSFGQVYIRVKFNTWRYYGGDTWNFYLENIDNFFIQKNGTVKPTKKTKFNIGDIVTPNNKFCGIAIPYVARGKVVGYSIDEWATFALIEWDRSTPVSTQVDGGYYETSLDYVGPKKETKVRETYLIISEDTDEVVKGDLTSVDEAVEAIKEEAEWRREETLVIVKVIKKYNFVTVPEEVVD